MHVQRVDADFVYAPIAGGDVPVTMREHWMCQRQLASRRVAIVGPSIWMKWFIKRIAGIREFYDRRRQSAWGCGACRERENTRAMSSNVTIS